MKTILGIFTLLFVAMCAALFSTTGTNSNQPKLDLTKPLVVVQFNASFNSANTYKGLETLKVPYQYIEIDKQPMLKAEHKIKSLPTVIIFKEGKEAIRWEGDIMLKLSTPLNTIKLEAK
jgi:hypothetical protein